MEGGGQAWRVAHAEGEAAKISVPKFRGGEISGRMGQLMCQVLLKS